MFNSIIAASIIFIIFIGRFHYRTLSLFYRSAWISLASFTVLFGIQSIGERIYKNLSTVTDWDFLAFWLGGKVALEGLNFYDPAIYRMQELPLIPDVHFIAEVINVGFIYPPPAILLFAPFSAFDYFTAYTLWYAFNLLILLASIYLLFTFFGNGDWKNLLLITAITLPFKATLDTVFYGQTNFILLFFLLLIWKDRAQARSGLWIALGFCIKPLFAVFFPWLLFRKKWKALGCSLVSLSMTFVSCMIFFGIEPISSYFLDPPTSRIPKYLYYQQLNHSSLAFFLKTFDPYYIWEGAPWLLPINTYFVALLGICNAWFTAKSRSDEKTLIFALLFGLLIYPNTLTHYSALTLLPIFYIWKHHKTPLFTSGFLALLYFCNWKVAPHLIFSMHLMLWGYFTSLVYESLPVLSQKTHS